MKINQKLWLLCISAALGLAACGGQNDAQTPAQSTSGNEAAAPSEASAQAEAPAVNLLRDAQALQAAEDALKALPQFGGKPLNVFQNVHFYGGSYDSKIKINIQDPNNPENIDHYIYKNGQWSEPQPVKLSGDGDMSANVTPLDQIKFATVAEIAKVWHEKAVEVQAKETEADHIYFSLTVHLQKRSWETSNIETDRAEYSLDFDQNGKLLDFSKR